jgi:similar to spore coat protein
MPQLGLHETLDAREILTAKNLSVTKAATMSGLVQCKELKAILKAEAEKGKQHILQLQELLTSGSQEEGKKS